MVIFNFSFYTFAALGVWKALEFGKGYSLEGVGVWKALEFGRRYSLEGVGVWSDFGRR